MVWAKGDGLIAQLDDVARQLHDELRCGGASASRIDGILGEVHDINSRPALLEDQFSALHGEASRFIKQMKDHEGRPFWTLMSAQPIHFKGEPCVLVSFANINERKQAKERLQFSVSYDALTGLLNRATFGERLSQTLAQAQRHHRRMALLFMDPDGFKVVNDGFGHEVGDALLREIAARLQSCLRKGDIVGRIGGDEFVALIEEFDDPGQLAVVARKIIETTALPMAGRGEECRATASIGSPSTRRMGKTSRRCCGAPTARCTRQKRRAKVHGKNRFSFHSPT